MEYTHLVSVAALVVVSEAVALVVALEAVSRVAVAQARAFNRK